MSIGDKRKQLLEQQRQKKAEQKKALGINSSAEMKKALGINSSAEQKKALGHNSSAEMKKALGHSSSAEQKKALGCSSSSVNTEGQSSHVCFDTILHLLFLGAPKGV